MIIEQFAVGMLQTNCYLVADKRGGTAIIIDPGGNAHGLADRISALGLKLDAILLTHAHFDHTADAWELKKLAGGLIYMNPKDEFLLFDTEVGLGAPFIHVDKSMDYGIDQPLTEANKLVFGGLNPVVLETPGHSPGHVSILFESEKVLFAGDLLFAGSIGRTDFTGGSHSQLLASVRNKVFTLDGGIRVYTGHGPSTTVAEERRSNPFFV